MAESIVTSENLRGSEVPKPCAYPTTTTLHLLLRDGPMAIYTRTYIYIHTICMHINMCTYIHIYTHKNIYRHTCTSSKKVGIRKDC